MVNFCFSKMSFRVSGRQETAALPAKPRPWPRLDLPGSAPRSIARFRARAEGGRWQQVGGVRAGCARRGGGLPATLGPARRPCVRARHGLQHEEAGVGRGHLLHPGGAGEAWRDAARRSRMWSASEHPAAGSPSLLLRRCVLGTARAPAPLSPSYLGELPAGSAAAP